MKRDRLRYFIAGCVVIALGLASRRYGAWLPTFLADYSGDTLWALMVFVGIGFLAPRWSSFRVSVAALLLSFLVEFSQLYQAPWINHLRRMRVGGLILGYGFLWSDLLCYTAGVAIGLAAEKAMYRAKPKSR